MSRGPAANLPGSPVPGTADYLTGQFSAASLLGLSPANQSRAAGMALPLSTHVGGDKASLPWHPDSPMFWLAVIAGATVVGLAGASVRLRVGKGRAGAQLGTT